MTVKDLREYKYIVVGAGFFGSVIAERIANEKNEKVLIIDKNSHVGGSCFSDIDVETGIEYHVYGTHIFHTSRKRVLDYLSKFACLNDYRHKVFSCHDGKFYRMPINLDTINSFYGVNLKPFEVDDFLKKEIGLLTLEPGNFEEKAISLIGRPLYDAFIYGYTCKQWGRMPKSLPAKIIERLPVRRNYDDNYFHDVKQGVPVEGYKKLFQNILKSGNITVSLGMDYFNVRDRISSESFVVYTGPIDKYFGYKHGMLEWRSLDFHKEVIMVGDFQGTSVVNYPDLSVRFTRIHEPRHLHPERKYCTNKTLLVREYPKDFSGNDGFYPVNTEENQKVYEKYLYDALQEKNVLIGGRLGDYKYYDMDQTIDAALDAYESNIKNRK